MLSFPGAPLRPALAAMLTAAVAATAAGCTVGPDYHRPDVALGTRFRNAPPAPAAIPADTAAATPAWWDGFGDPGLGRAVRRALEQNLDLQAAAARIAQSRAAVQAAQAALYPRADLGASAADVQLSLLSPFGAVGRQGPGFERDFGLYDLGPSASWEIDLFGGLRRARQAARADDQAQREDAQAVRVCVAAETADAYLQVRAFQGRLAVARSQETVELRLVTLLRQRLGEGVASDREVHQASAALEGVRAAMPPLQAGAEAQSDRLDILMGAPAGTYAAEISADAALPAPPVLAGLGGPTDLLRRRPDILAAERRLAASDARIGAAVADYYPKISLSGLLGVESLDASRVFVGDALQHQVAAGLRWRLFDFGRVDAEVARAKGVEAEALAAYRATVYRATGEVETALSDLLQAQAQAAALDRQIAELTRARDQADEAYRGGAISLIEVLDADRDLLTASDQLARARADAARAAVAAFRATGQGGRA